MKEMGEELREYEEKYGKLEEIVQERGQRKRVDLGAYKLE
jgi:hypothetical protein